MWSKRPSCDGKKRENQMVDGEADEPGVGKSDGSCPVGRRRLSARTSWGACLVLFYSSCRANRTSEWGSGMESARERRTTRR